jgi:DNA-directed RNA polymerase subunit RPC12/RpoP
MAKIDEKIICEYCGREFKTKGYLRQHLLHCKEKTKSDAGNNKLACPDCGAAIRKLNLDDEDEYYLYTKGCTHICDQCEEVFTNE